MTQKLGIDVTKKTTHLEYTAAPPCETLIQENKRLTINYNVLYTVHPEHASTKWKAQQSGPKVESAVLYKNCY